VDASRGEKTRRVFVDAPKAFVVVVSNDTRRVASKKMTSPPV